MKFSRQSGNGVTLTIAPGATLRLTPRQYEDRRHLKGLAGGDPGFPHLELLHVDGEDDRKHFVVAVKVAQIFKPGEIVEVAQ